VPQPDGPEDLNPNSVQTITAQLSGSDKQEGNIQFERPSYFIRDRDGAFNRTVTCAIPGRPSTVPRDVRARRTHTRRKARARWRGIKIRHDKEDRVSESHHTA
jgi:hypothetical protein